MIPKLSDNEWLQEQYIDKRRTLESIAEELGCNKGTVGRALKAVGIQARKRTSRYAQLDDYEWLYDQYVVQKKGLRTIAKEAGASPGVVAEHLKQKGIQTRSVREGMDVAGKVGVNKRLGEKAANWKGGRHSTKSGYITVYAPDHPNSGKRGYVMEHRLVMEQKLGRYLEHGEIVHHIDGNKQNNHPDNLELKTNSQHISEHFKASHEVSALRKKVKELEEVVERYQKLYGPLP